MFLDPRAALSSPSPRRDVRAPRPPQPVADRSQARGPSSERIHARGPIPERPRTRSPAPELVHARGDAASERRQARAPASEHPEIRNLAQDHDDTPPPTRPDPRGGDWGFIWRRKSWVLACMAAALIAGLVFHAVATPRYRAITQILISPVELRVFDKALMQPTQTADANVIQVESETRVLTSDKVLRRVVESERLTEDPEFGARSESRFAAAITSLRSAVGLDADEPPLGDAELTALRVLQRNVSAKRTERTFVVDLMVDARTADKAARIANAIAQAYLDEQSASRTDTARRVTDALTSRLAELRERVRHAEEITEHYKAENNIVDAGGRLVQDQQLTDLNNQVSTAKARTADTKARYDKTVQQQRGGTDIGSMTEAVNSSTVGRLREQYAAVARQEATLSAELGPRHPWVIEARAQVRNLERLISEEVGRVADANRIDYERALANETALSHGLDSLKQKTMDTSMARVRLRELEREVDASRAVYESFLVRARETREQEQLDSANVRIISDAQPPRDKSWPPRLLLVLLGSLMLGLLSGIGFAYVVELRPELFRPAAYPAFRKRAAQ